MVGDDDDDDSGDGGYDNVKGKLVLMMLITEIVVKYIKTNRVVICKSSDSIITRD